MADIYHDLVINAPADQVFAGVSTPDGLNTWWTKTASGDAAIDAKFLLGFGADYQWKARITRFEPAKHIEFTMIEAHDDWLHTKIGVEISDLGERTKVKFYHTGWPELNDHYKGSVYCWGQYLRILKRYLEYGETVAYENRLE